MLHHLDMRLIALLFAGVLGTGCYASTGYTPMYGGSVGVTATTVAPDLVYVSPGVQVIADYDEPIFYSDGFYWRETGGTWYRSTSYTGGWGYYAPPRHLLTIRDRHAYRHYRPAGYTPRNRNYNPRGNRDYNPRPAYRNDRPSVRDNRYDRRDQRWERPAARPAPAPARPAPARHDNKRDDDRKDHKDRHR